MIPPSPTRQQQRPHLPPFAGRYLFARTGGRYFFGRSSHEGCQWLGGLCRRRLGKIKLGVIPSLSFQALYCSFASFFSHRTTNQQQVVKSTGTQLCVSRHLLIIRLSPPVIGTNIPPPHTTESYFYTTSLPVFYLQFIVKETYRPRPRYLGPRARLLVAADLVAASNNHSTHTFAYKINQTQCPLTAETGFPPRGTFLAALGAIIGPLTQESVRFESSQL